APTRRHVENRAYCSALCQIGAPPPETRDVLGAGQRPGFTDEALHPAAVGQLEIADAQRRRNLGDELAEARQRDVPQLDDDRGAAFAGAGQTRLWRYRAGQRVEL